MRSPILFALALWLSPLAAAHAQAVTIRIDSAPAPLGQALRRDSVVAIEITKDRPAPLRVLYRTDRAAVDSTQFRRALERRLARLGYERRPPEPHMSPTEWLEIVPCFRDICRDAESESAALQMTGWLFQFVKPAP